MIWECQDYECIKSFSWLNQSHNIKLFLDHFGSQQRNLKKSVKEEISFFVFNALLLKTANLINWVFKTIKPLKYVTVCYRQIYQI